MTTFNPYNIVTGRLSGKKLSYMADQINAELLEQGATMFCEYGSRYNYHAVDQLNREQLNYRMGDKNGRSSIMRTYDSGLTAQQCKETLIKFYYESLNAIDED